MKLRLFIVDDDQNVRDVMANILRRCGHDILTFPDACSCCRANAPACPCSEGEACADAVLTDLKMPDVDGLQFLDGLQQRGCRIRNKAIISAYWTSASMLHAFHRGYRVFEKPAGIWDVEGWLATCVKQSPSQRLLADHFRGAPTEGASPAA
jgi:CheY-like chemotaxis protein